MVIVAGMAVGITAALIGGVYVVLALAAAALLTILLQVLGDRLGWFGGAITDNVASMVDAVQARARTWADAGATPFAAAIAAVPNGLYQLVNIAIDVLYALWYGARAYVDARVDGVVSAATGAVGATLAAIQSQISTFTNQLIPALQYSIADVAEQARLRIDDLYSRIAATYADLEAMVRTMIGAEAQARAIDVADVRAEAVALAQSIEAGINDRVGNLVNVTATYLDGRITTVDGRVTTLANELERLIPGISAKLTQLELDDIAAATAAATTAATIARLIRECIDPLCGVMGPQVPGMRGVSDMLVLGLVGGLLTAAIVDPEGAAAGADSLVAGPTSAVMGALQELAA